METFWSDENDWDDRDCLDHQHFYSDYWEWLQTIKWKNPSGDQNDSDDTNPFQNAAILASSWRQQLHQLN